MNMTRSTLKAGVLLALSVTLLAVARPDVDPPAPAVGASMLVGGEMDARWPLLPPGLTVDDRSYAEWTVAWWQWAVAFGAIDGQGNLIENPITDPNGQWADLGQSGPMYFLAGTFGGGPVVRDITITSDKYIMATPLDVWWDTTPGIGNPLNLPDPLSVDDLRAICDWFMDRGIVTCTIDGWEVPHPWLFRVESPVFSMNFDPEFAEWYGGGPGIYPAYQRTAVSDGFWLIIRPLSPGQHVIHLRGEIPEFQFVVDVTYNITVQP